MDPAGSVVVGQDADPETTDTAEQAPIVTPPARKWTVPPATPPAPLTLATSVTSCPYVEGFTDEDRATDAVVLTICATDVELLLANVSSPEYTPMTECRPAARAVVAQVATPAAERGRAEQPEIAAAFERKVTVPVGVSASLVTVAVKVTDWPRFAGLREDVTVVLVGSAPTVLAVMAESAARLAFIERAVSAEPACPSGMPQGRGLVPELPVHIRFGFENTITRDAEEWKYAMMSAKLEVLGIAHSGCAVQFVVHVTPPLKHE